MYVGLYRYVMVDEKMILLSLNELSLIDENRYVLPAYRTGIRRRDINVYKTRIPSENHFMASHLFNDGRQMRLHRSENLIAKN